MPAVFWRGANTPLSRIIGMKDILRKLLYADEVAVVEVEEWTIVQDICLHVHVSRLSRLTDSRSAV